MEFCVVCILYLQHIFKLTTGYCMEFDQDELVALAQYDMEQGRLEAALLKLKQVVRHDTAPPRALAMAAKLYAQLQLFSYAKRLYERYIAVDPASEEVAFELGMVHFDLGETDNALSVWTSLLNARPTYPPALFYSALALSGSNRFGEAKRHLDVLLQTAEPDNLYFGQGRDLLRAMDAQALQQPAGVSSALM